MERIQVESQKHRVTVIQLIPRLYQLPRRTKWGQEKVQAASNEQLFSANSAER